MKRRWLAWFAGIAALALFALFPLRIALGMSDFERIGFTARQVGGTIWYGRIGDLQLRSQPLGTFEVELDPAPLLLGKIGMRFNRLDSPEGRLRGRLMAGLRRGIVGASGRIAVAEMMAPLPIEALELRDVTVLFRRGVCVEASGAVTPLFGTPIPGVRFAPDLTGQISCDGERARVIMVGPNGAERFEIYVSASGSYRGWITIRNAPAEVTAALAVLGFRSSPDGLVLSVQGRL